MASFYSNDGDRHMLPNEYLLNNQKLSYDHFDPDSIMPRDEMVFIPPSRVEQINRQMNFTPDTNHHRLSLSLGSQEPSSLSSFQYRSGLNQYDNSSLCSVPHLSQNNGLKNVQQYLCFDSVGKNAQFSDVTGALCNSKYLEPVRSLLDELVSVHRVTKRVRDSDSACRVGTTGMDAKGDVGVSGEFEDPSNNASRELSVSERHELQNKMAKLVSMLDEVDRRYKQYWHQMQAVASSFDAVVCPGASLPYTALALRTISRQFRSLRDVIKKQILSAQNGLGGDPDVNSLGAGVVSRLRYVDQQLRQQKSLHQFGGMRQTWRPQRGLPENAVSVLRAWLFEHFLHPYPKDSEKVVLARETGLTRGQVANWFINARVRLWKPMIEEMYKEEFGYAETELKSSPEHITTNQDASAFNQQLEFQESVVPTGPSDKHMLNISDGPKPSAISNADIHACTYSNDVFQGNFGLAHMHNSHNIVHGSCNISFCDSQASERKSDEGTRGNQVTLALGLQRSENDSKAIEGDGIQPTGNEYFYVDPSNNNQNRFANAHMLSDFVA